MPRPRAKAGQRAFYPHSYQAWREEAIMRLRNAWKLMKERRSLGPQVALSIELSPKKATLHIGPAKAERNSLRGDLDNYAKALMDVIVDAGILDDDARVTELEVRFV